MREIKFRAWDKEKQRWVCGSPLSLCVWLKSDANKWLGNDIFLKNIDFQQFTGLKDKNGVEIFEGDIVKYYERILSFTDKQKEFMGEEGAEIQEILIVDWDNEGADFQMINEKGIIRGFNARGLKQIEVIGNIYESKHLLDNNFGGVDKQRGNQRN